MMGYQYLGCFADPITLVCNILTRYKSNKVHVDRIDQLSEDAAKECEIEQHKADQDALFQTESFDFYKGEAPEDFLYHIGQLTLKKNGLYVIKGENGSGKSMLMNLMLGNISSEYSKGNFSVSQRSMTPLFSRTRSLPLTAALTTICLASQGMKNCLRFSTSILRTKRSRAILSISAMDSSKSLP